MADVLHHENHGHDEHHHHDDTDITVFGFWTYLMSDLILFGTLFIAFAVLVAMCLWAHQVQKNYSVSL